MAMQLTRFGLAMLILIALALLARFTGTGSSSLLASPATVTSSSR